MKKLLLFLLPTFLFSCIWIDGTTIDGNYKELSGHATPIFLEQTIKHKSPKTKLEEILKERTSRTRLTDEVKEDDAVILMLKGEYEASIKELLELNEKNQTKYSIASNLGTAYELNGENKKALQWITEGIKRDSNSHYGTEWLHQLILKVKIELEKKPKLLEEKRVITLPKKFTLDSNITIDKKIYTIYKIKDALQYQLQERLVFVKPQEAVVADLLFTFAKIEAQTSTLEEAISYLELAKLYGFSDPKLLEERMAFYQNIIDHPALTYHVKSMQNPTKIGDSIVKIVVVVLLLIIAILLKRFFFFVYRRVTKREKK
jgi:tetratricopeptide (TPR) repeat protein